MRRICRADVQERSVLYRSRAVRACRSWKGDIEVHQGGQQERRAAVVRADEVSHAGGIPADDHLAVRRPCGFFRSLEEHHRIPLLDIVRGRLRGYAGNDNFCTDRRPGKCSRKLVFYHGGKVEYTSYAPLMLKIAESGTDCFLCEMPYDLAVFGINAADKVMDDYSYDRWYIGGHSLGGAMAAVYAGGRADISGLVLLGAYPVSQPGCPSLLVYGSKDGVVDRAKLTAGISYDNTTVVEIPGGNHAGFGCYGSQSGDNEPDISGEEQWNITAAAVRDFVGLQQ